MKIERYALAFVLVGLLLPRFFATAATESGFSDVEGNAWYAEAVIWCQENDLTDSGTAFSPETVMTRAMVASALYRASGRPDTAAEARFTDVSSNRADSAAIAWAAETGVIAGYGDGRFGPEQSVTRQQFAAVLWRYAGKPDARRGQDYADEADISSYAVAAVDWARDAGVILGKSGNRFDPYGGCTRAQAAVILHRYLTRENPESEPESGKILVAYFSRAGENYGVGTIEKGNTAIVAEMIAERTGGDLFEIVPETPYPSAYGEILTIAQNEKSQNARPEIANAVSNMDEYGAVFIGYPIWHGDMPMIVYHFLESYDFAGKTVIPFNTHEGSGQSGTQSKIEGVLKQAAVLNGLAIQGKTAQHSPNEAERSVKQWLSGLRLPETSRQETKTEQTEKQVGAFDLETGTVLLNSGYEMPILGIGTYALSTDQAENSVYWALRDGYRLIDTARIYGNEEGVGRGIRRAIQDGYVKREEIFVTTKMWTSDYDNGAAAADASLRRLGLDYIDLMILHHSQPSNDVRAYQAMEQAVKDGKLRSIGLSNYYTPEDFDRLASAATVTPALLQNETHPYHQSKSMKEHLAQYGTVLESWFPLGGRGNTRTLFNDETIAAIAAAHGKTSAQVILRWHLQAGNIAIPGSGNEAHIAENL